MDLREKRADLSLPRLPVAGVASWVEAGRVLKRSISLCLWSGIVAWRWLLLMAVFALAAGLIHDTLSFYFEDKGISRQVDAWDLFPAMLRHTYHLHFLFGFGFLLLIGDSYQREREQGTTALIAVRMPSRPIYWLGKMGAMGVMALLFVGLCLLISLVVGLVLAPPSAAWPMLPRESLAWMYPHVHMPLPVYVLLLAGYTAWALWTVGCAVMLLSLIVRHKAAILVTIAFWTLSSLSFSTFTAVGYARLLGLGYFISLFKHESEEPMSLGAFFAISAAVLVMTAFLGSWRLQREEL